MNAHIGSRTFLALMGVVVLWASAFPAIRVGVDGLGVAALSFLRLAVAALALAALAPLLGVRRPRPRDLPLIALAGATGMTAYQVLLNWGEVHVSAGTASMLISIAPVFSVLLGRAFLSEPVTRRVVVGSGVALGGSAIVALAGGPTGFSAGALVVLAAAAVQGVYHFVSKPLLRRYSGLEVATYAMVAGAVLALPLLPATLRAVAGAPAGALVSVAYLGLLPSALGFVIWGYAVARLPLTISTAALYLVPPVTLIVSFLWLSEVPRLLEVAGGIVIISGVVLISRRSPAPARDRHAPASAQHQADPAPRPVAAPYHRHPGSTGPLTTPPAAPGPRTRPGFACLTARRPAIYRSRPPEERNHDQPSQ
ncbi:EamA family transporter [Streptomyces sp. NPDC007883]|uniref:DMT family transporter n=1 Tax=Streptomyces sp. NPDC007883 TaxID=3155116 RepID=UPI0033F33B0B